MRNPLFIIVFGFYRYFQRSKSSRIIAYESALMVISLFLYLNILAILDVMGMKGWLDFVGSGSILSKYAKIAICVFLPLNVAMWFLVPKKSITDANVPEEFGQAATLVSFGYVVVTIVLLLSTP